MKKLLLQTMACFVVLSTGVIRAQTVKALNPFPSFGPSGNGRIEPGSTDPLLEGGASDNQRGLAVDPVSGNLVFVDTHSGANGSSAVQGNIFILDGNTGATIATLNTNGMSGGNYADVGALV